MYARSEYLQSSSRAKIREFNSKQGANPSRTAWRMWPETGYRNSQSSGKGITLRAVTSKERCAQLHNAYDSGGFGLWVGLWEALVGRSRRRRCAAVRFDAANEPRKLMGEVVCWAPLATVVVMLGILTHSRANWIVAAVKEASWWAFHAHVSIHVRKKLRVDDAALVRLTAHIERCRLGFR